MITDHVSSHDIPNQITSNLVRLVTFFDLVTLFHLQPASASCVLKRLLSITPLLVYPEICEVRRTAGRPCWLRLGSTLTVAFFFLLVGLAAMAESSVHQPAAHPPPAGDVCDYVYSVGGRDRGKTLG